MLEQDTVVKNHKSVLRYFFLGSVLLCACISLYIITLLQAPKNWEEQQVVIEPGSTVKAITEQLADANVVRSSAVLYIIMQTLQPDTTVNAGTYMFTEPRNVLAVAEYVSETVPQEETISVTVLEGTTASMMADIFAERLSAFEKKTYTEETAEIEGFLFPETYFIPESYTADDVIKLQTTAYGTALQEISVSGSSLTEYEAVIIASILEREANSAESMGIVSGIFQNRLALGMPLQADATIEYVLDTPLNELRPGELAQNLRDIDSPYNTYKNTGLPPTPIGNPGAIALNAAYNPIATDYLYYITGADGTFHYANSYAKHRQNIALYLQ